MARKNTKSSLERFLNNKEMVDEPLVFKDKRQVDLDLQRVSLSKAGKAKLEQRVSTVLAANPELSYYQGFHDIAMHTHSTKQLENLSLQQLRDFMAPSMLPTQQILALIPELLHVADKSGIGRYFASSGNNDDRALLGYFAVAPVVTLFSHYTDDSMVIMPIIRNVLREGLSYIIYLYVALLIENPQLFQRVRPSSQNHDGLEEKPVVEYVDAEEVDMALSKAGELLNRENYAFIDTKARRLRSKYPLRKLATYKNISRYSVLKTGKVTKRSTALFLLHQLDSQAKTSVGSWTSYSLFSLRDRASSRLAMVAVAVGAVAFGMLISRSHRS